MSEKEEKKKCPCTWPGCDRHGDCEACCAYHHALKQRTACEREQEG